MGFWNSHPMAGDLPLDAKDELDCLLFSEDEIDADIYMDEEIYKERLIANLHEAIKLEYPENQKFVLPFIISDLQIQILDKEISDYIKNMIGDGGNMLRGYPPIQEIDNKYLQNYNNFQTPLDYANHLRDLWDELMLGNISFTELKKEGSLINTLISDMCEN